MVLAGVEHTIATATVIGGGCGGGVGAMVAATPATYGAVTAAADQLIVDIADVNRHTPTTLTTTRTSDENKWRK